MSVNLNVLWEDDLSKIFSIPLGGLNDPNRWMWNFTVDGSFTTKSAYKVSTLSSISFF